MNTDKIELFMRTKRILLIKILFLIFFLFSCPLSMANIILKVVAVNPSKEQNQKADVKAYLPKEIQPEHILDKEDLEISYDTQQGSYYVLGVMS